MKIQGTNRDNITVKMTSTTLSMKDYNVIEKTDPNLEVGQTRVSVTGYPQATAQSYRHVYKNGVLISTTKEAYSSYKRRDEIVYVGTKKPATTPPADSTNSNGDTTTSDGE